MSAVALNIVIGLVTTLLSGGAVWARQRVKSLRLLQRREAFFGLGRGGTCLIIMNSKWNTPGSSTHDDVHAMIEVATLAQELGCRISVRASDGFHESNGERTEFCVGGPESNARTRGHLASQLPGVTVRPVRAGRRDSAAIVVGDQRFLLDEGTEEYVLVAKFTPPAATHPVILICGQTPITNRAATHFLKRDYREVSKVVASLDRFCVLLRVDSAGTYGYEATGFECGVSATAFAPAGAPAQ